MRYKPYLEQSRHNLVLNIPNRLPQVNLDPSRMEQVLVNLLSNASKYSPANTPIELSVLFEEPFLLIKIKDAGKGLSETDQKSLFRPYHRLKQDQNVSSGLGLGLFICKQIVEAHGGEIQVQSQVGVGGTFRISLPIERNQRLNN